MTMAYGGHPGRIAEIEELARERGWTLLEDAAHAIGSRSSGRAVGTFGLAGAYSFFSNKNLAIGEGGAVVTADDDAATRMRLLRSHGMTTLTWDRHRGHASSYDVVAFGFNYRMDEPRATLALARLTTLEAENAQRREIDRRYRELLSGVDGITPTQAAGDDATSAHHIFTVVLDERVDRDALRAALAEAGVQTSMHYPPAHRFSVYASDATPELPVTDAYAARSVTLPLFAHMTEGQQDLVIDALRAALPSSVH
jgi:dTDP-4-amino-4,6-dideoxygalactose transaminase